MGFRCAFWGVLLVICSINVLGQINTGKITGFVTDSSGGSVSGVPVVATNDATGVVTKTDTTDSGEFLLTFLVPGTYHVTVEKEGFKKDIRSGVIVDAGGIARIDFTLQVGDVGQTVAVETNTVNCATETSQLSPTFSHPDLDTLPNPHPNPLYQINLIPRPNNHPGSGHYGTNGGENGSAV